MVFCGVICDISLILDFKKPTAALQLPSLLTPPQVPSVVQLFPADLLLWYHLFWGIKEDFGGQLQ